MSFPFFLFPAVIPKKDLVADILNRYPFTDRIGKHDGPAQLRQFAEVTSGTVTFYHPAITGSETITSSGGDASVSVIAGGIVIGVGKAWSIKDSVGHHWSHCAALSPTSAVMWDVSGFGDHLVAEGLAEAVVTALCSTSRDLAVGTDWLDRGFTVSGDVYQVARLANGSRKLPDNTIVPVLEDGSSCAGYLFTGELSPGGAILHYDAEVAYLTELVGGVHTLNHAVLGPQYQRLADGSYINVGAQPAVDVLVGGIKGLRTCGAITNLLPGDTSIARAATLTAQAYTLQVFGAGSVSCSYGTATVGSPLTFTATAGTTTFTPSGATLWMLTATSYPTPYVPPGVTQPASNATATNGTWFAMPNGSPLWQALTESPLTMATRIMMGSGAVAMVTNGVFKSVLSCGPDNALAITSFGRSSDGTPRLATSSDGSSFIHASFAVWSSPIVLKRFLQVDVARSHYRVGLLIEGTHTTIQWSHPSQVSTTWAVFDGSFNPSTLYRFMLGYNNPYPQWFNKITAWKLQLSDAELLGAWT